MIKKIFITLFFISFFSVANASDFCNGFKNGFITGYKSAKNTNMNPMVPFFQ
jgi:thioredoxin-related protein